MSKNFGFIFCAFFKLRFCLLVFFFVNEVSVFILGRSDFLVIRFCEVGNIVLFFLLDDKFFENCFVRLGRDNLRWRIELVSFLLFLNFIWVI